MGDVMTAQPHGGDPPSLTALINNPSKILFQQEVEIPVGSVTPSGAGQIVSSEASAQLPPNPSQPASGESPLKRRKLDVPCAVCHAQQAKYRCPGCGIQTCRLECSQGHKQSSGCTGQRNKTAMVQMAAFDESNLISDYNFLEETLRHNEAARRMRNTFEGGPYSRTPGKLMALINQARNRRIELILLSSDLSRRRANTSYYDKKRKCFFWRIEWLFPSADTRLATHKLDEHQPPLGALTRLLEPRPGNAVLRHTLRDYCAVGMEQLVFLLRKDCCPASDQVYYKLDPTRPLRALLARKTLIEFPVIIIALPSEVSQYKIEEEPEASSESAWGTSSGKGGHSSGSMAALVDPRLHLYAGGGGEGTTGAAAAPGGGPSASPRDDGHAPPDEVPILRGLDGAPGGGESEAGQEEDAHEVELAALLAEAAMADFTRETEEGGTRSGGTGSRVGIPLQDRVMF